MESIFSTIFVILIIVIPIIIYLSSLSTVTDAKLLWFNGLSFPKMPDLYFRKFGVMFGSVFFSLIGIVLFFCGRIFIRSKSVNQDLPLSSLVPKSIEDRRKSYVTRATIIEDILFFGLPLMLLIIGLAYPLMCQFESPLTGGIMLILTSVYFLIFGLYMFKYSGIICALTIIFAVFICYTAIYLFLIKKTTTITSKTDTSEDTTNKDKTDTEDTTTSNGTNNTTSNT